MLEPGCTAFVAYDPDGYDWDEDDCKRLDLNCDCNTPWFAFDGEIIGAALEAANISTYHNWSEFDAGSRFDGDIYTARRIKDVLEEVKKEYGGFDIYYEEADLNCDLDTSAMAQQWQVSSDVRSCSGEVNTYVDFIEATLVSVRLINDNNEILCYISPANIDIPFLDEMIEAAIKRQFPILPCVHVGLWNDGGDDCIFASISLEEENSNSHRRQSLAHQVAQACGLTVVVP